MGSLLPDLVFAKMSPLLFLAVATIANGLTLAVIPTFKSLLVMNLAIAATGVTFGIVDMGIQGRD